MKLNSMLIHDWSEAFQDILAYLWPMLDLKHQKFQNAGCVTGFGSM